jgi:hypothetical protein
MNIDIHAALLNGLLADAAYARGELRAGPLDLHIAEAVQYRRLDRGPR